MTNFDIFLVQALNKLNVNNFLRASYIRKAMW